MSGFEKHGLKHTSPSQINMWADAPGAWVAKYLFGFKFKYGVAAQVGVLTEKVVEDVLLGSSFKSALEQAHKAFKKQNATNTNEHEINRIKDIEPMALNALEVLKPYGEPEVVKKLTGQEQQRIELKCNGSGWELPVIGYLDFVFPDHGLIVDLKTTLRCPSVMSRSHQRQAAIYAQAKGNMAVKFLYVTPKKSNLLELEDRKEVLDEIKIILNRQERMLDKFSAEELRDCVPLGLSSFYWNDEIDNLKEFVRIPGGV